MVHFFMIYAHGLPFSADECKTAYITLSRPPIGIEYQGRFTNLR